MRHLVYLLIITNILVGCKYYGSAVKPEYPMSMENSLSVARDRVTAEGGVERSIIHRKARPAFERPSYIPEKEMAVIAPPKTLLVWTYPHVTDDNTRVFGSWSTIFLTDRYEWVLPTNEVPLDDELDFNGGQ